MCVILYKLFKCSCKEATSVDPCPMMDRALDLVDIRGVPEDDPLIQRLENECSNKSARRYEIQSSNCDLCDRAIAAVGIKTWLVEKAKRDLEEEENFHVEMDLANKDAEAAVRKSLASRDLVHKAQNSLQMGDGMSAASTGTKEYTHWREDNLKRMPPKDPKDIIDGLPSLAARSGETAVYQHKRSVTDSLDNKDDAGNPTDLEIALVAALAARTDLDDYYDGDYLFSPDEEGRHAGSVDNANGGVSRSGAPSPSQPYGSADIGLSMS